MKIFLVSIISIVFVASCCLSNRKCKQDYNSARFRILKSSTGEDLLFGPSRVYDKNFIKFYSINGPDTIVHHYGPGPNPTPGQDSLLFVDFNFSKQETVYVRLSNSDVDTLKLAYSLVDASPCCPDYSKVNPVSYNNILLGAVSGGITIIQK
jgi:hypothetical protein